MRHKYITWVNFIWALPIFILFLPLPKNLSAAETESVWFKNSNLEFSTRTETVIDAKYPTTYAGRGNIDCSSLTLKKRDGIILDFILKIYKESSVTGCHIESSFASIDPNGFVNVSGTDYIAEIVKENGQPTAPMVFPANDLFISNASASPAVGTKIWFSHLRSSMKFANLPNGKMLAVIKPSSQIPLTDKAGNALPVMADNFAISENGEWAVVDSPGKGVLRINLTTFEVLPFTGSFEFGNGIGAALRMAISSDGRFAVVASKNYNTFKLFDLSTCGMVPNVITGPVSGCRSRDLLEFARTKINSLGTVLQVRFLTDELVKFYASYDTNTTSRIGEFVIAAPNTYLTGMDYLGMGDSFASGEGAHKYEIGTDDKDFNMCHLSKVSYPYLIARKIQANNFHSVACSGARTVHVRGGTGYTKNDNEKDRDNQYKNDERPSIDPLKEWAPGYKKQVSFISINNPKVTTVSVAGNDINFSDKIIACLKPGTCFPSYEDRLEVFNEIDSKLASFTATYKKLKEAATKNARVYVIGYPQIALAGGECALNVHLNESELEFAASVVTRLNAVVKAAASAAEVNYVDVEDAFFGSRLCENDSDNVAMNGLTAGKDIFEVIGNESYHPNEFGHELLANKILGVTNSLGNIDPITTPIKLEKIKDTDPALKKAPKTNRTVRKRVSASVTKKKTATKSQKVNVSVKGTKNGLTPNTPYTVIIGGQPAGSGITDENGDIEIEIPVPPNSETGPQPIDIEIPDITGQPVVIGGVIVIGNDGDDFDQDNVPDFVDSCPIIINAKVDSDEDGVDDSCDPIVGPAPTNPSNPLQGVLATASQNQYPPSGEGVPAVSPRQDIKSGGSNGIIEEVMAALQSVFEDGISAEELNPAPFIQASHNSLKEYATTHPQLFASLLTSFLVLLLVLRLRYRSERNKTQPYTVYG